MSGMTEPRPIVVGIDGSDSARLAAVWAAGEAARRDVELRLVHTVGVGGFEHAGRYVPPADFYAVLETRGRELLEEADTEVRRAYPAVAVKQILRNGHPTAVLIDESERAGLVAVGSRGLDAVQRVFAGSTAVHLAAHGQCAVAVIHGGTTGDQLPEEGPVVVGVDGSPASEAAIALAFEEASARRTRLIAVHAGTDFVSDHAYLVARQCIAYWEPYEERDREMLAERLAGWQEKYPDVPVRRVNGLETPACALLDYDRTAQLMVVGSRGRGGFAGMLLGSVSRKLINQATCPLIVARPGAAH